MSNLIVILDDGEKLLLNNLRTYLNALKLCLGINDLTPAHDDAADGSDYTEASFPGYARQTLDYGLAATNAAPPDADLTPSVHTFTRAAGAGAPQTIYFWFVMDESAGKCVYASRTNRSSPTVIEIAGDVYQVQPTFTGGVLPAYP